ncbi:hypothetical protein D9758_009906 [Tetrapyrgos nigripes]|uniref:Nephrocystin 3-like N-terminal domain-containing protein n=1 Tax=Tetrapyrgos nigripes TaxID=182062 RepID=A0A8H5GN09_9AGAR|nr:hypothetical protein D9758_009906 [Tetrapyrgos nigripes]
MQHHMVAAKDDNNPSNNSGSLQVGVGLFHQAHDFSIENSNIEVVGGNQYHYHGLQYDIISKLNPTIKAFHDVGARSVCIEGTRTEILENVIKWADEPSPDIPGGYWMCGMAGTGKSTIAKSLCLKLGEEGLLAGTFFCSRQIQECKEYHNVIPTIAYQLAQYSSEFAAVIREALNMDPDIAHKEPDKQIKQLFANLWKDIPPFYTPVVIIDALDECENISLVLKHLIPAIRNQEIPGLKFFLTSRPEQHVKDYFDVDKLQQEGQTLQHFYLHNVQKSIVRDDISIFLQQGLSQMCISKDNMDRLLERSGVLFIYAATIIKYITGGGRRAQARLANILDLKRTPDKVETQVLDDLYGQILEEVLSLSKLSHPEQKQSLNVIYTVITTATPVSCQIISELLKLDLGSVQATPLRGHTDLVRSVAVSFDGTRIASGSLDQTVRIWDAISGEAIGQSFQGHEDEINSVAFSPNGTRLASGSDDKTVRIWDILTGDTIGMPFLLDKMVMSVSFSPDGARIAAASGDMKMWDGDGDVTIFDAKNGDVLWQIKHRGCRLNFSPDGTRIVSASWTTVRIWDANTGAAIGQPYEGHQYRISSVVFSPDGSKIISGSDDKTVRIWDSSVQPVIHQPGQGHEGRVYCVAFSPDGARIVSGSDDNTIRIWDTSTGNAIGQPLLGHTNEVNSVAFSPDGTRMVSSSLDKTVRIWDASTGNVIVQLLLGHTNMGTSVSFSPDGTRIVSGSDDQTVRIWDAHTGNAIGQPLWGHKHFVTSVAFSPDGTRIVSGSLDDTVRIWDANTGNAIRQPLWGHTNSVRSVAFSPDGARIVSGSDDTTVRIWDANTGNAIGQPLLGHANWVTSVAFSHDGSRIVSGSYDRTVRIWDANTGNTIGQPLLGHANWVTSVAFSHDGTRIASGSYDHTLRIQDATTLTQPQISHELCTNSASEVTQFPYVNHLKAGSDFLELNMGSFGSDLNTASPYVHHRIP